LRCYAAVMIPNKIRINDRDDHQGE
jgi:hypothetical protein